MSCELFVGNLPYSVTEQSLSEHFAGFGQVESVKIITDAQTGRSRGFGFVKMGSLEEAQKAIQALDGKDYEGRSLKINPAGGGGGGGGGQGSKRRMGDGGPRGSSSGGGGFSRNTEGRGGSYRR